MNSNLEGHPEEVLRTAEETAKLASDGLRYPLATELGSDSDHFSSEAAGVLKHHGIYQQVDRDILEERRATGNPSEYRYFVRVKIPAGKISASAYLVCDRIADVYGQENLRVTSRNDLQIHGIRKRHLVQAVRSIRREGGLTTLGACGDLVRSVAVSPLAEIHPRYVEFGDRLVSLAEELTQRYLPQTRAYDEIWLDTPLSQGETKESFYGAAYLPRKFKIALAAPFDNAVDILSNDVGLLAYAPSGHLGGYDVFIGGGLGFSAPDPSTFSRLAKPFAFVTPEQVIPVLDAILTTFRDRGNRTDRTHARLKYLVERRGIVSLRAEIQNHLDFVLDEPRGLVPEGNISYLGWHKQRQPGLSFYGFWLPNGRIRDVENGRRYKTALQTIARAFNPVIRFTPSHHVILSDVLDEYRESIERILAEYNIPREEDLVPLRRYEMACPSFPFCGRAYAEAERYLPVVMSTLEHYGFANEDVIIRLSGCPNGCSRARTAEIGILGRSRSTYMLYAGGSPAGYRLNELVHDNLDEEDLADAIATLLRKWRATRFSAEERFGDWAIRYGVENLRAVLHAF